MLLYFQENADIRGLKEFFSSVNMTATVIFL